jgi:translocation and assembly module TamB
MKMNRIRLDYPDEEPSNPQRTSPRPPRYRILRLVLSIAACLVLLIIVCAAGLVALVNVDGVHRYLIGLAERQASDELGVRVQLENFTLHLSTLSVDLYGISVDGSPSYQGPRLLTVDHVAVGVRVVSIFGRKWYLDNLTVDHPIAWVFIDKNGASNLPSLKSSSSGSNTSVWSLGIRHAALNRGEVYFNSRPCALDADVHDLDFLASFNSLRTLYSGSLNYANGRIKYGSFRPFSHNLAVKFEATPTEFRLKQAQLASGPLRLALTGTLDNYSHPAVRAHYDAIADGTRIGELLGNASIPAGLVHADGDIQYRAASGGSLIDAVTVDGRAASGKLEIPIAVKAGSAPAEVDNLAFEYSLAGGNVTLRNLRAQAFGGELHGQGQMKNIGGATHSTLSASVHGISLQQLQQTVLKSSLHPGVNVLGTLNATATASWGRTISDMTAHADASIQGEAAKAGGTGSRPASATGSPAVVPVESAIHATYSSAGRRLELDSSYLRTPQTTLTLNGTLSTNSSLGVRLQANDLRELTEIAGLFRTSAPGQPAQPLDVTGKATFAGTVTGATDAPQLTGELTAQNLEVNGAGLKMLRTSIDLSPNHVGLRNAELDAAPRGRITLNAGAGLEQWSFSNRSPVQMQLNAAGMDLAEVMKIAARQEPASGTLNVNLALHGSVLNPEGSGKLTVTNASIDAQPVRDVTVNFSGNGEQARADLHVDLAAGSVEGEATVEPQQKAFTAQLSSTGIRLDKLEAVTAHDLSAEGTIVFDARGQGTFDNPEVNANVEVPKLVLASQSVFGTKLQAHLENRVVNATLASSAMGAEIQAKARVQMANDYQADASLDTKAFPLAALLAAFAPDEAADLSGETEIHATVHGPLKHKSQLEAHVTIPDLKLGYSKTIQLAAAAPIQVDYQNGVIHLQPTAIRGTDTDLNLQAAVPMNGNGPMALVARGTVNLQLIQLFDSDLRSSGQVKLNIDSRGPVRSGNLAGQIEIANVNLSSADLPVGLEDANGVLTLTTDRINVDKFEGSIGGGKVTAQGGIAYRPNVQFNLNAAAKGIRILYPQGMRESVDATLRLAGTPTKALLGGSVDLADISFTQAFDLNSFIHQFSGSVEAPQAQGFSQDLALNIAVRSTNNVNLVSRTLSVGGSANVQLRGTAANPVVLGRVNLSGGDIILNGDQFSLTGGTIQFVNPSQTEPVVDLSLNTKIQDYTIDLHFNGPVDQMRTDYNSDPALPQADIINLLAFGETTEAAANSTATANQTAESLVASQVSSAVTSRISKVAGISQLSVSPVLAGSSEQGPPGAVITIRQRVTGNLFVTFSTNVATTQDQTIQGQYQVSPRVAISATRDPNGGFGVDALIKKSW